MTDADSASTQDAGRAARSWTRRMLDRLLGLATATAEGVEAATPEGVRLYAVGDVHGRADLFAPMLARIREDADGVQARVVTLGDYVDRGPRSRETLDLLIELRRDPRLDSTLLMGNHEEALLGFLADAAEGATWMQFGGRETLASYGVTAPLAVEDDAGWEAARGAFAAALPAEHLALLQGLEPSLTAGGYFFAHAGVRPGVALDAQEPKDLLWIREGFLRHRGRLERIIVHGHTPTEEPHLDHRRIGVDTGAYATGVLTAVRLDGTERRWLQVARGPDGAVSIRERLAD